MSLGEGRARVVIESVHPTVDGGRFAAKRIAGDTVTISADAFLDGHDHMVLLAEVWRPGNETPFRIRMHDQGNDHWTADVALDVIGRWTFRLVGYADHLSTWRHDTVTKLEAGVDVRVELEAGALLVEEAAALRTRTDVALLDRRTEVLVGRLRALSKQADAHADALAYLEDAEVIEALEHLTPERWATTTRSYHLTVDRPLARFSTWYELFPRSASPDPGRHGTLADVATQLDELAALGIDVLYLPPIHPIGFTQRKGRNGATQAAPDDPGSPWGIGNAAGGHDAVHPELGTYDDVVALAAAARERGIELALDIAWQCSPDHPWVKQHPSWFRWRPDGTVQYAENPPKKYQDIFPLNFESEDWEALWHELDRVVRHWVAAGVTVFRVDNPHTKTFTFWEWLITRVKTDHPEVLFLSEAFTRPRVMHRLAKLGFSQSYTYFTWRTTAEELRDYLTELTSPPGNEYFRPNLWPNTPDILHEYLQHGGRAAFITRLVLAGGLGTNYGIYGPPFELCIGTPREPGSEEYLDSEKFQVRHWGDEVHQPHSIRPLIARLNRARRQHVALQRDEGLTFHPMDNPALLCWSKAEPPRSDGRARDVVLAVVNLDPHGAQHGHVELDMAALGLDPYGGPFEVEDLLSADDALLRARYTWDGARTWVRLDPHGTVAHLFHVHPPLAPARALPS